jgi:hypothetical protein
LPAGLATIGSGAFSGCKNIAAITIPDSVTTIGEKAFAYCESITDINIPDSITDIGNAAFEGCKNLNSINVNKKNKRFTDIDGILSDKNENRILCYPAAKKDARYTIPAGTRAVIDSAFSGCKNLTTIDIPDSVTTIGDWAFSDCESLVAIDIPESVTVIGNYAFCSCKNLIDIAVEKQNPYFVDVNGILFDKIKTKIMCYPAGKKDACYTIPAGTTAVMDTAFSGCKNLTTIEIPDSVSTIGCLAFSDCESLKTVYLSRKTSVDAWAFGAFESTSEKFVYTDW